ncbi:MAG TPA: hypothetical protein VE781_02730 [Kineosporiaceae bacterium]|nr:hypothetical protein [Kineosporiaceae bacterium]
MTRDPGLQPERTALGRQRTGVATLGAVAGTGLAAVHRAAAGGPLSVTVAALLALAVAAATVVVPSPGRRREGSPYDGLLRAAAATVALAAAGLLLTAG